MGLIPVGDSDFSLSFIRDMTNFTSFGHYIVTIVTTVFLSACQRFMWDLVCYCPHQLLFFKIC